MSDIVTLIVFPSTSTSMNLTNVFIYIMCVCVIYFAVQFMGSQYLLPLEAVVP